MYVFSRKLNTRVPKWRKNGVIQPYPTYATLDIEINIFMTGNELTTPKNPQIDLSNIKIGQKLTELVPIICNGCAVLVSYKLQLVTYKDYKDRTTVADNRT